MGKTSYRRWPAVIFSDNVTKMWYLNDKELTEEEFTKFLFSKKLSDSLNCELYSSEEIDTKQFQDKTSFNMQINI